jgi:Na+-translocating ferredoxin:NAD+ oxidoreductase RnfD subunit
VEKKKSASAATAEADWCFSPFPRFPFSPFPPPYTMPATRKSGLTWFRWGLDWQAADLLNNSRERMATRPTKLLQKQAPMRRVMLATLPCVAGSVYFFGWRALAVIVVSCVVGFLAEWFFCRRFKQPVSEAVFVTAVLYALVMPPTVPWHVVVIGMVFAVIFTKMLFGGFGRNIFNPALAGRCFVYICFPVALTAAWAPPAQGVWGGLDRWSTYDTKAKPPAPDAITGATPMAEAKKAALAFEKAKRDFEARVASGRPIEGSFEQDELIKGDVRLELATPRTSDLWKDTYPQKTTLQRLFFGRIGGTMGVTSALLILIGGLYLFITKTANRTIILSTIIAYAWWNFLLNRLGVAPVPDPLAALLGGGFLFGAFFMATDPVSAAKTRTGQIIYGIIIGSGTLVVRNFSIFNGGLMFSILLANMFAPIIDYAVIEWQKRKKAKAQSA